ncbi:MAG TPA: PhnD/SsuA/transferrin family substrate-binding protein [Phycisphaerae bacterium]|nr:PhnD/SsuA/transferrin family substrate-binding protein [Phycisphaerae bacterium]
MVPIGSTKADLFGMPAEYRALHPRLEECFGRMVRFQAQPDGPALGKQLELGNIPYALMSAGEYAAIPDTGKLTLVASGVNALDKTSHKAYVVVKAGSHVKTISDCSGKRFAFGTYGDLLTDTAARSALEKAGVPVKKLLIELVPPPLNLEGRLYLKNDTATTIAFDPTVNAGVIDEIVYSRMPESGGNLITGPSKDQFTIVGETVPVPEMVVVAGPAAEPELTAKFKSFLINKVKDDKLICDQLGIKGFAEPDKAAYDMVRTLAPPKS